MEQVFDPVQTFAEAKTRRVRQLRMMFFIWILLVVLWYGQMSGILPGKYMDTEYGYIAAALLTLGALAYTLSQWRCPGCQKHLWHRMNPKHCPGCGIKLSD